MKIRLLFLAAGLIFCASVAARAVNLVERTITLHAPGEKYSGGWSCFNFQYGVGEKADGRVAGERCDLYYGFFNIGGEDFFQAGEWRREDRSVIKDLGALSWLDHFDVPALKPLPVLAEGKTKDFTLDSSAGKQKGWEQTNGVLAKAVVGHIYAVRVKDDAADYYALFRVEGLEQQRSCTISWRLIPPPEQ